MIKRKKTQARMKREESHKKALQEILQNRSFDKLNGYLEDNYWRSLNSDDRRLLAELLILHGEQLLPDEEEKALAVFEKSVQIIPDDPSIYCVQGLFLSSHEKKGQYFAFANNAFDRATALDPNYFEAWFFWGKLLQQQAEKTEDEALALQADKLFLKASECKPDDPELEANLYWNWGMVDSLLGRLHGEAIDFNRALKKFSISASLGACGTDFWEHYGHVVCELGSLVNRPEALIEGCEYFTKAVEADPANGSALLSVAYCNQKLYEITGKFQYCLQGCESFEVAQKYNENDPEFWFRWGLLLFLSGRQVLDLDSIELSFEKFEKGHVCNPDSPHILAKWAEAEMVYGFYDDRIDLLRKSEARIVASLKILDNNPEAWYIYGTCLSEMGRYFFDASYYLQAVEKFQYGLYLSPKDVLILQGISQSYYALGEMKNDTSMIELSVVYSEKAVEASSGHNPQLYNDWGVSLMKMAEMTSDKAYLESAVEKFEIAAANFDEEDSNSFDPEWLYNYGCALDFLGDFYEDAAYYEKAILVLSRFLQLSPDYHHAHYNVASAYSHLGELIGDVDCFHKAIEHYQKFLSEDNEDELVWSDYGLTLLNLAELLHDPSLPHLSQVCLAQAEEKFFRAISLGSNGAFYNLACLYSLTKHYPQAMFYLEKAERQRALPPLDQIIDDEWLENLRQTPEFRSFLTDLSTRKLDN